MQEVITRLSTPPTGDNGQIPLVEIFEQVDSRREKIGAGRAVFDEKFNKNMKHISFFP